MRFVVGLAVGLLVGFALGRLLLPTIDCDAPAVPICEAPAEPDDRTEPTLYTRGAEAPAPAPGGAPEVAGARGLAVGQGLVLATGEAVTGGGLSRADIVIDDIRDDHLVMRAPHGAAEGAMPLGFVRVPDTGAAVAATFADGPADYPLRHLRIASYGLEAVAFVRDGSDQTHLVWVERVVGHAKVLRRRVYLGSRPVEALQGGGVADVPTAVTGGEELISTRDISALADAATQIPNNMNHAVKRLRKELRVLRGAGEVIRVAAESGGLVLPKPVTGSLTVGSSGVAIAAAADTEDATVEIGFHGVLVVCGDLRGDHVLKGHAHVHVTGDIVGTAKLDNHATLVVEGDIRGEVHQGDHTKVILLGVLRGALLYERQDGANHARLFLSQYVARSEMTNLPKGGTWPQLYVRDSDLGPGKHRSVGGWDTVHVGGDFWSAFDR